MCPVIKPLFHKHTLKYAEVMEDCTVTSDLQGKQKLHLGIQMLIPASSVAPIIESVIGNTLYRLILSISVSDLYTYQIASRSDMVALWFVITFLGGSVVTRKPYPKQTLRSTSSWWKQVSVNLYKGVNMYL